MTRVAAPSLHSATLLRLLTELDVVGRGVDAAQDFGDMLGQWLDIGDAIALSAALNGRLPAAAAETASADLLTELARLREQLESLIRKSCAQPPGETRLQFPAPSAALLAAASGNAEKEGEGSGLAGLYTPYHRFYLAVQRELDNHLRPLRVLARETLGQGTAEQKRLAALDAVLDKVLGERERRLLGNLPLLLEKRFTELWQGRPTDSIAADGWLQTGGWLATFRDELQRVLLAELELRLLPVTGLAGMLQPEFSNDDVSD